MDNHYHLVIETPDGNLPRGMRQLNGVYTQRFNRRHSRVGHVFQGRYKAILVQEEIGSGLVMPGEVSQGPVMQGLDWLGMARCG